MSDSSEDEIFIDDYEEVERYAEQCYLDLKNNSYKVQKSDTDTMFWCPYCPGKKKYKYPYKDLLQHATDIGKGSLRKSANHTAKHLGLAKYLRTHHGQEESLALEFSGLTVEPSPEKSVNSLFVHPWMGILANVTGERISKIKADLAKRGYETVKFRLLSDGTHAVVEFQRSWSGFYSALMFEKDFEADHHGKKDYFEATHPDGIYGWTARDADYHTAGAVGSYLEKNGDLRTPADVEASEKRNWDGLIKQLVDDINHKNDLIYDLKIQLRKLNQEMGKIE